MIKTSVFRRVGRQDGRGLLDDFAQHAAAVFSSHGFVLLDWSAHPRCLFAVLLSRADSFTYLFL